MEEENDIPDLEMGCEKCCGLGSWLQQGNRVLCSNCNGSGVVLTKLGERVIDFVQRNIKKEVPSYTFVSPDPVA